MSAQKFFEKVKQNILQHPCFNDPFINTISTLSEFPLVQARRFGLLYYPHILRTRLYQANALGITPDENIQFVFAQILHDEYGNGDAAKSHMAVYRKFLTALGISDTEMLQAPVIPELELYIDSMMRLTQSENWLAAVGAVGIASEWPIPHMYNKFLSGLRRIPGIKEDDLELFSGHVELDIEHAGMMEQAILPHLEDEKNQQNLLKGIHANLNARRIFMQGLYREVFITNS